MPRISGTVSGLDPDTTYDFQVRVVDALGNVGDWSNVAQGTTLPQSGGFLYFNSPHFYTAPDNTIHSVETRYIVTIAGATTFTIDRNLAGYSYTYNGQTVILDDAEDSGWVVPGSDPNDPGQIAGGEWILIDLVTLRSAYPSLSTISVEVQMVARDPDIGTSTTTPSMGAWGHLYNGDYVHWNRIDDEPANYIPFQLYPLESGITQVDSAKLSISAGDIPVYSYSGSLTWSSLPWETMATFSYDDSNGELTVS
jgi:hypothetical protein